MTTQIKVPEMGESVTEGTIARWFKAVGEAVAADEALVEIETDKVTVEIPAPAAGVLTEITADEGSDVEVGAIIGAIDENATASAAPKAAAPKEAKAEAPKAAPARADKPQPAASDDAAAAPAAAASGETRDVTIPELGESVTEGTVGRWLKAVGDSVAADEALVEIETDKVTAEIPAPVAGVLAEISAQEGEDVEVGAVIGRIAVGASAEAIAQTQASSSAPEAGAPKPKTQEPASGQQAAQPASSDHPLAPAVRKLVDENGEERVRMTKLRQTIATRLKDAQNTAAMLTTFNEVDMSAVMALRSQFRDDFEKKHGVKLGFMSFFVKAAIKALHELPSVNAEIHGDEIVYKDYYDIGIAVGGAQGLVVPVLRDADKRGFADIEAAIGDFGMRARDGKLTMADLTGGTFTITNGGIFGSMLSTPILNPPQSGILGMHNIVKRAVVGPKDEIVVRPMMYLALSYDHRIVDGREAVTFLVRIKQAIEDPQRLLLDI